MSSCEIHAIFLKKGSNTGVINLSHRYDLNHRAEQVLVVTDRANRPLTEKRVASFTTLFGENGCGKTELMMQVCQTFSQSEKGQRLGVLYSEGGKCYLHPGEALSGWRVSPDSVDIEIVRQAPALTSIFYSSSPFENARLKATLSRPGIIDVCPKFTEGLAFDGLALCQNLHHIIEQPKFLRDAKIEVRGWISDENEAHVLVDDLLKEFDSKYPSREAIVAAVREWMQAMPKEDSVATLANLILIINNARYGKKIDIFIRRLARLISEVRAPSPPVPRWKPFVELCRETVAVDARIKFNGAQVLDFIQRLGRRLGGDVGAYRFKRKVTPGKLAEAIAETDKSGELARFVVNYDFMQFTANTLSSGEFAFLFLFAAIGSGLKQLTAADVNTPVFLLIDEGEMFLHPSWQGSYISKLLNYVEKCNLLGRKIHLMISTHSLIVAADAPPRTLFDVQWLEVNNGFGLGPKAVLTDVYHIDDFAGAYTAEKIEKLAKFLREPKAKANQEVRQIVEALADPDLKNYVNEVIRDRRSKEHA
ncbi:AAA family ATPase [Duganella radicis]|uniref:AAA family ATPase n=1 Tax=Duganella radicis TaxID=551988 RepID=A0A6L6PC43_9BURK|nr:AAA family ATPase [Duganella radicis]MTV36209.1 AAA family ATPase [Duganella radicis]